MLLFWCIENFMCNAAGEKTTCFHCANTTCNFFCHIFTNCSLHSFFSKYFNRFLYSVHSKHKYASDATINMFQTISICTLVALKIDKNKWDKFCEFFSLTAQKLSMLFSLFILNAMNEKLFFMKIEYFQDLTISSIDLIVLAHSHVIFIIILVRTEFAKTATVW